MTDFKFNCEKGKDYRDWKFPTSAISGDVEDSTTHRGTCPPVLNQGSNMNCVGHSGRVVYGESDHLRNLDLSAMHLYKTAQELDYRIGENYEGTTISGACKALFHHGICTTDFWDNNSEVGNDGYIEDGASRKISAYYVVDFMETDIIKKLLEKECLWISFETYEAMLHIPRSGRVEKKGHTATKHRGGHAVALIGYRYFNGELHWEIQNSWGTGWGDRGYAFIPHSLMKKIVRRDVYVLVSNYEDYHTFDQARVKEMKEYSRKSTLGKLWFKVKDLFREIKFWIKTKV